MANQNNFATDLNIVGSTFTKYTVSRVVTNLANNLIDVELPTTLPSNLDSVVVEFSLYSLFDNQLVYSGVIKNTDKATPIKTDTFRYTDNTTRTILYIDFSQLDNFFGEFISLGQYQVTFNIFVNEIGSDDNKVLRITKISPSRKEVELQYINPTSQSIMQLKTYVEPAISSDMILNVTQQIYSQMGAETLYVPASPVGITTSSVLLAIESSSVLVNYGFAADSTDNRPGVNTLTRQVLDNAYKITSASLLRDLNAGTSSFTAQRVYGYVTTSLRTAYDALLVDEATNPAKYRFDLI